MSIQLKHIDKYFGERQVLYDISFTLNKGEIVGFLGPNGAGKSTTMKIICGYMAPTDGEVFIDDKNVAKRAIEAKKRIGYLPENNPLYHDLYVREYLRFIAEAHGIKRSASLINGLLDQIDVKEESRKKIGELSKGYRQRVGLAAALLNNPDALILDEPTAGLDPNQTKMFKSLLLSLSKEKTILFSSHILSEIEALCKRCIIINKGKIIADGSLEELKQREEKNNVSAVVRYEIESGEAFPIDDFRKELALPVAILEEGILEIYSKIDIKLQQRIHRFFSERNILLAGMEKKEIAVDELFSILTKE